MFYYILFDALVLQAPMMRVTARPLDTGGCLGRSAHVINYSSPRTPWKLTNMDVQYWVTYAFFTVIESVISAAYWFRKFGFLWLAESHS